MRASETDKLLDGPDITNRHKSSLLNARSIYYRLSQIYHDDHDGNSPIAPPNGTATVRETVFTLITVAVGIGILSLPRSVFDCGLLLGMSLLVGTAGLTYLMTTLLSGLIDHVDKQLKHSPIVDGEKSLLRIAKYEDMGRYCFGFPGEVIVSIFGNLKLFGSLVAQLILTGKNLDMLISWDCAGYRACILLSGLLSLIFAMVRDMDVLARYSSIGTVSSLVLPLFLILVSCKKIATYGVSENLHFLPNEATLFGNMERITAEMGMMLFAYNFVVVMPSIKFAMANPPAMYRSLQTQMLVVVGTYAITIFLCFLAYSDDFEQRNIKSVSDGFYVEGGVQEGFKTLTYKNPTVEGKIASILIIFSLLSIFPIMLNVLITSMQNWLSSIHPSSKTYLSPFNIGIRVSLVGFIMLVALFVPFFSEFIKIMSSALLVALNFVFPILFCWKIHGSFGRSKWEKGMNVVILIISLFVFLVGTKKAISDFYRAVETNNEIGVPTWNTFFLKINRRSWSLVTTGTHFS